MGQKKTATNDYCLATINPLLAKEWHPSKNENLTPYDFLPNSSKTVWWQCREGHEWKSKVRDRNRGNGCPYCSRRVATVDTSLATEHPDLAKQWHPTKNGVLTAFDVLTGSGKKVWWICAKGHEWQAVIGNRSKGVGCPYCAGFLPTLETCLLAINPTLAHQWHPTKNGTITPTDVKPFSNKKVWWLCSEDATHEWQATVGSRHQGSGCPYCDGKRATPLTCLASVNPSLASEWHPTKNGQLTPFDVTSGSNAKAWWRCSQGHEWQAVISNRTQSGGCPYCSRKRVSPETCLAVENPILANEWHPTKNGALTAYDVLPTSGKQVWWRCDKGHEWKALISNRKNGRGCPLCASELQTSFPEQAVYFYIKKVFSDAQNRRIISGDTRNFEIDVFIPSLKLGIEYDGYYHYEKLMDDMKKNMFVAEQGIQLIRIRDSALPDLQSTDSVVFTHYSRDQRSLKACLIRIGEYVTKHYALTKDQIEGIDCWATIDLERDRFTIYDQYVKNEKRNSLAFTYPELASEWHPTRNGNLEPSSVLPASRKKVWWRCEKGHEWEAVIYSRKMGTGCPYCYGRNASLDRCLATVNPTLAAQWHETNNGSLTPYDVMPNSSQKIWWRCNKGHEWQATPNKRTQGRGCPYCSNRRVTVETCLATLNPDLAREWHPWRNEHVMPDEVGANSNKKVWWLCSAGHEWQAIIANRNKGNGCPICRRINNVSHTEAEVDGEICPD